MGQARIVEGVMDCIEAVEVIGRTRLGIMVLYMENSGREGVFTVAFDVGDCKEGSQ